MLNEGTELMETQRMCPRLSRGGGPVSPPTTRSTLLGSSGWKFASCNSLSHFEFDMSLRYQEKPLNMYKYCLFKGII